MSGVLVLSTIFMTVSFSPDIVLCGWLGLRHQLANLLLLLLLSTIIAAVADTFVMIDMTVVTIATKTMIREELAGACDGLSMRV